MGKIVKNGITYGGKSTSAGNISYDNTTSELQSQTVQNAITELKDLVDENAGNDVGRFEKDNQGNIKGEIFNTYTGNNKNIASGNASHAEGYNTTASGNYSHAGGQGTVANEDNLTAIGKYNVFPRMTSDEPIEEYLFIIGNGEDDLHRSNIVGVTKDALKVNGDITIAGNPLIMQCDTIPVAARNTEGRIVQYTGTTNGDYTHGHFYECISDEEEPPTYFWIEISVGVGQFYPTGTVGYFGEVFNSYTGNDKNIASGGFSHAEGSNTTASGGFSHAEGSNTTASGGSSHAEGESTTASGDYGSHAEGYDTTASGDYSHAEGNDTTASGVESHAEGYNTTASGDYGSHAEGSSTEASGQNSHAEGSGTTASGSSSHAEGLNTTASGNSSHAEGCNTTANGGYSHAEGNSTIASEYYSHAEGENTTASGYWSHAEGRGTIASGSCSHAEGWGTQAIGINSHAGGSHSIAVANDSTVIGRYNIADIIPEPSCDSDSDSSDSDSDTPVPQSPQHLFIIGNGLDTSHRSNIVEVTEDTLNVNGDITIAGKPLVVQCDTMSTADEYLLGRIVQYVGATDANYTHGCFYECVSDGEEPPTYSWQALMDTTPTSGSTNAVTSNGIYAFTNPYRTWRNGSGAGSAQIGGHDSSTGASGTNSLACGYKTMASQNTMVAIGAYNRVRSGDLFNIGNGANGVRSNIVEVNSNSMNVNGDISRNNVPMYPLVYNPQTESFSFAGLV